MFARQDTAVSLGGMAENRKLEGLFRPRMDFVGLSVALIIVCILCVGFGLRLQMVKATVVPSPLRADAGEYYSAAHNMRHYGVYATRNPTDHPGVQEAPAPDAQINPGYPLFLVPFLEFPPTPEMVQRIVIAQALLSTLTILVCLAFFRVFLSWPWALVGAVLVALSPHMISANVYVLTEPLFTFLLALTSWLMAQLASREAWHWPLAAGLALGCALLVRPTMTYFLWFLMPAMFVFFRPKRAAKLSLILLVGFSLSYGPWVVRNVMTLGDTTKSTLAAESIHKGMYPGLMYQGDPKTYGIPNHFDPQWGQRRDTAAVLAEILHRVEEEPMRYLRWYLVGKPVMLFSWDIVVGMGDVYIYPVSRSPFHESGLFRAIHRVMRVLHWPLVVIAIASSILVWLPSAKRVLSREALIASRFTSLLLLYFVLVHVAGTPLPRYAIPLRPFIYGMGVLSLSMIVHLTKQAPSTRTQ